MSTPTLRLGFLLVVTSALAACGGGAAVASRPAQSPTPTQLATPAAAAATPAPADAVSPIPAPYTAASAAPTPAPAPAPVITVAPPVPAAPPMAHASSQMFSLVAVGDTRARGAVTVTVDAGRAQVSVVATGLPPGSMHSVHLHFGDCPSAGSHILVLGTLRADASGSGSVSVSVNAAFVGPGHFVIIYVGPTAGPLGACANLG